MSTIMITEKSRKHLFAYATDLRIDFTETNRHALVREYSSSKYAGLSDLPEEEVEAFIKFLSEKYQPKTKKATMLPTEKTHPRVDLSAQTILAYGAPKIGKSSFFANVDKALFIATEPGLNCLDVFQVSISTWDECLTVGREIYKGKHEFKAIVIDTVDNLYKFCSDHVCRANGIIHESDLEWGKGWSLVNAEFFRLLNGLSLLPYGLILISHSSEKELKGRTGKYNWNAPDLPKGALKTIRNMSDLILFFDFEDDDANALPKRVIRTKPTQFYDAGDRTGRLPETMDMDYSKFIAEYQKAMKTTEETQ